MCASDAGGVGLLSALAFAFLGGLILNLMPCVFPVLALKVVGLAGADRTKARWHAVAYTAGVLAAFAGLCAALLLAASAVALVLAPRSDQPLIDTVAGWLAEQAL